MTDAVMATMERLYGRLMMAIGRGRITSVNDGGNVQKLQVQLGADEVRDATPRLVEYGLTSVPPAGTDVLAVFLGGDRSNGVVVATGHQASRPKGLKVGEVCVYDDQGQEIRITRAGIVIKGAGKPITIQGTPKVRLETDRLEVTGDIHDRCDDPGGRTMADMRAIYNEHTHGGVQSGPARTDTPLPQE
ncbi:phage baseplate assembly protein V [Azospirillum brasilense]|uniref:Phage baseplate assembly protein V n=1 Tax=Azospirillum brasilense TaxID=192 RepID=A0A4D8R4D1_AZOBR|nr:phage baseplate assembly protein V [Azospirillum brasilense]QCO13989.1 phage baseplate assembly protein V [Azospirillum brasilense]